MTNDEIETKVIDELRNRKGFRHWWDDIDEETQQDILSCIASRIGTDESSRSPGCYAMPAEEKVLKAVYESGLHQYAPAGILVTKWKDGIDIDEPSLYLMNFVRKLLA